MAGALPRAHAHIPYAYAYSCAACGLSAKQMKEQMAVRGADAALCWQPIPFEILPVERGVVLRVAGSKIDHN